MRYLYLGLLLLAGCSYGHGSIELVDPSTLKFSAGDKVRAATGFYSKCEGTVTSYIRYKEVGGPGMYAVSFSCPNVGRLESEINLSETSLSKAK